MLTGRIPLHVAFVSLSVIFAVALVLETPALALTKKEKMETCEFGAKDQKLKGAAEKEFIRRCMAEEDADTSPAPQAKKK